MLAPGALVVLAESDVAAGQRLAVGQCRRSPVPVGPQAKRSVRVEHAGDELAREDVGVVATRDQLEPAGVGGDRAGEPGVAAELGQARLGLGGGGPSSR
jgi:hypothetical protein